MRFRYVAAAVVVLLAAYRPVLAAIGDVDALYGQGGRVVNAALLLADGRALGPANNDYGGNDYLRFDASGRADSGFGNLGKQAWPDGFVPNWNVWLRYIDGSTLLGGTLGLSAAIVHLDAAGQIDPAFAGVGVLTLPPATLSRSEILGLALQPDGQLFVLSGEYSRGYSDSPGLVLVRRLDSSMTNDSGFGTQGEVVVADYRISGGGEWEVYGQVLTLLKDGRIWLTDQYTPAELPPPLLTLTHLSYLQANGAPSIQPLPDPTLDPAIREWRLVSTLPDGGMLIDGSTAGAAGNRYRLIRLQADGLPDARFGNAGSFTVDEGTGQTAGLSHVSAEGRYIYIARERSGETTVRRIHLEGAMAGQVDTSFGRQGIVRIAVPLDLTAMQGVADGSLLLVGSRGTFRLLPTSLPSPGVISFEASQTVVTAVGPFTVRVNRFGGSDGAVVVNFAAVMAEKSEYNLPAVAGADFLPQSGQLSWADGEEGAKSVTVTILPDYFRVVTQSYKPFLMQLASSSGGAGIDISRLVIYSQYGGGGSTSSGPAVGGKTVATAAKTAGGGGAFDLVSLLGLCLAGAVLCAARHRRSKTVLSGRGHWFITEANQF